VGFSVPVGFSVGFSVTVGFVLLNLLFPL
jgi:hypothetical protein